MPPSEHPKGPGADPEGAASGGEWRRLCDQGSRGYHLAFSHFGTSLACDGRTDRHIPTAYSAHEIHSNATSDKYRNPQNSQTVRNKPVQFVKQQNATKYVDIHAHALYFEMR